MEFKSKWMNKKKQKHIDDPLTKLTKGVKKKPNDLSSVTSVSYSKDSEKKSDDDKAREAGFLALHTGEVYERQITRNMHVFISRNEGGKWSAWRESFSHGVTLKDDDGQVIKTVRRSASIKKIANHSATFDYALMEAMKYVKFVAKR